MGRQGTWIESRELAAGCRWGLGIRSGLGWNGDVMEGQGLAGDATFHDLDRDVTREWTWPNGDGDAKAGQGEDENREAGNGR
jgi:hypothetical protein